MNSENSDTPAEVKNSDLLSARTAASMDKGMAVYDSAMLFGSATEIGIHHQGALYRLRVTRQGKLILNK